MPASASSVWLGLFLGLSGCPEDPPAVSQGETTTAEQDGPGPGTTGTSTSEGHASTGTSFGGGSTETGASVETSTGTAAPEVVDVTFDANGMETMDASTGPGTDEGTTSSTGPGGDEGAALSGEIDEGSGRGSLGATETSSTGSSGAAETGVSGERSSTTDGGESSSTSGGGPSCEPPLPLDTLLIAGGRFTDAGDGPNVEHVIEAFRLDRHEVTVAEYELCAADGVCSRPDTYADATYCNYGAPGRADHPVNCVSWFDAEAYCAWACGRLPDEWEWEWAARGRGAGRTYPWGEAAPSCEVAAMFEDGENGCGLGTTRPVGSKSPAGDSLDGVRDMGGNVWEWTDSFYSGTTGNRVLRGGGWYDYYADYFRADYRRGDTGPSYRYSRSGIRCARTVEP